MADEYIMYPDEETGSEEKVLLVIRQHSFYSFLTAIRKHGPLYQKTRKCVTNH